MMQKIPRKPGEIVFYVIAFLFGAAGYYFALGMTSGELSSPSVAPKIASAVIMAMSALCIFNSLTKKTPVQLSLAIVARYLFSKDVFVILIMLVIYAVILPILHFNVASFLFLITSLLYLQRFKKIPLCLGVSVASLAILVAVFNYIFKVQLP